MLESALWKHLKPELMRVGKFQKVSDRFTPGIPDVLGITDSKGVAAELKEFDGVRILRVEFRPGQLDWLQDWEEAGGNSYIISTIKNTVVVHKWQDGLRLEAGMSPAGVRGCSILTQEAVRGAGWRTFVNNFNKLHK